MAIAPTEASQAGINAKVPKMIAVASGKGGVGKTWFAITLAHAFANAGRKTLLFDGDLGLANVDIQLGLMPKHDLGAVVSGRMPLNQATTTFEDGGFDIIAGRSGSGSLTNIPTSRLQILSEDLLLMASRYDRVILDLVAGVENSVRQLLHAADTVLVVTRDEPTSLADAYAFIKLTALERPNLDIRVIINASNSTRAGERTYKTLCKACHTFLKVLPPLAGIIRSDARVRETIRSQTPILIRSPNSEASLDITAVAERLIAG